MKRKVIALIVIIFIMSITIFLLAFNRKPFNENNVIKVDTHILAQSYTDSKDINAIISALNSSKPTISINSKIKSHEISKFTIYFKNGTKKNIKIHMTFGTKSEWFFEDNPSKIYKMKSSQVDKIYNVLKIL